MHSPAFCVLDRPNQALTSALDQVKLVGPTNVAEGRPNLLPDFADDAPTPLGTVTLAEIDVPDTEVTCSNANAFGKPAQVYMFSSHWHTSHI